jgi:hypothetical protein
MHTCICSSEHYCSFPKYSIYSAENCSFPNYSITYQTSLVLHWLPTVVSLLLRTDEIFWTDCMSTNYSSYMAAAGRAKLFFSHILSCATPPIWTPGHSSIYIHAFLYCLWSARPFTSEQRQLILVYTTIVSSCKDYYLQIAVCAYASEYPINSKRISRSGRPFSLTIL